jgi:hypothetical protein
MMLQVAVYSLVLINNANVTKVGESATAIHCAAAIGYLSHSVELQGGSVAAPLTVHPDGSFSVNLSVPQADGAPDEILTISCSPVVI